MQRRDEVILKKIIMEINIGEEMMGIAGMDEFFEDEKLKRAISMTVINIGELIKSITEETRKLHPEVPWKAAAGMRDIAAHKYQTLRMEDVYYTVKQDFPILKEQLGKILENSV